MSTIEESVDVSVPVRTVYNQWTQTRVMLQLDFDPEGIPEQLGDHLGFVRRRAKDDLERFKKFIEARGTESGAWRGDV
jgi:uncharacterized membrane protein